MSATTKLSAWGFFAVLVLLVFFGRPLAREVDARFQTSFAEDWHVLLRFLEIGNLPFFTHSAAVDPGIADTPERGFPKTASSNRKTGEKGSAAHNADTISTDTAFSNANQISGYGFQRSEVGLSYANPYPGSSTDTSEAAPAAAASSADTHEAEQHGESGRAFLMPEEATLRQQRAELEKIAPMVYLPGGRFHMGNDHGVFADQRPRHEVRLDPFEIDRTEVTNLQYRMFVEATGYRTLAQRRGWSYVFDFSRKRWVRKVGACWFNPEGRGGTSDPQSPEFREMLDHPVVHVGWDDAVAFCRWAGKRLPTEAEWEYAARAGRPTTVYPWGDRRVLDGRIMGNFWQGIFPRTNSAADGYLLSAPVGSFPESPNGLVDLGGNVAEWCHDRYAADYYRFSEGENPVGPDADDAETVAAPLQTVRRNRDGRYEVLYEDLEEQVDRRNVRGGSFMSSENNGAAYRVDVRSWQPQTLSYRDLGFRAVRDLPNGFTTSESAATTGESTRRTTTGF